MKKNTTIIIITDDQFFRDAATYFLNQRHYEVLSVVESGFCAQLLAHHPDLVILHIRDLNIQRARILRCIQEHSLPTKMIIYTTNSAPPQAPNRLFLTPADGLEALLACVATLEGIAASKLPAPLAAAAALTTLIPQERNVLAQIGRGLGSDQIAASLFVSKHTIKNHKTNITRKLSIAKGRDLLPVALHFARITSTDFQIINNN